MDYRDLLIRYMAHVGEQEGTYFLGALKRSDTFTEEEVEEFKKLGDEADRIPLSG